MQQQGEPEAGELKQQPQATSKDDKRQIARPDECGVCMLVYDELERRPRNLPCGHTYCSLCVSVLLQDGHLICPICCTDHHASEVNVFPINYALETMMKVMTIQQVEATSQVTREIIQDFPKGQATEGKTKRRATAVLSRKLRSMIQEQKVSIDTLETTLQKELGQLSQYRAKLAESRIEHSHLLQELDKVVQRHQANMNLLQEEDVRVEVFMGEGDEVQRELKAAQTQLDQVSTAQEAFTTINATDNTIVEVEEWLQHSREEMPNGTLISTSLGVLEATKTALEVITEDTETEATPDQATSGHMSCTIMEAVETSTGGTVKFVNLCSEKLRSKLKAGRVFATQKYADGTCYSSKMTCKGNKVYLHALKIESPPRSAFTLQVSNALKELNYTSISVFLDLAWAGTSAQRVHIRLWADTPLTRQFVTLCLGHTGLTYCNTNLLRVVEYYTKVVWGGNITSQKAAVNQVLPPIEYNVCGDQVYGSQGMVVARTDVSDVSLTTEFGIVVNNSYSGYTFYRLGYVEDDGLEVMQEAIDNCSDINSVRVVDCGVVF